MRGEKNTRVLQSCYEYVPYAKEFNGKKQDPRSLGEFFTLPAFESKLETER